MTQISAGWLAQFNSHRL